MNRKQAYADREEFTDRRASYKREREGRKKRLSAPLIDAKFAPTGRNKTLCVAGGSGGVCDGVRAAHPLFLRLHIELISDPGQRIDGFGQDWTVHTHRHTHT